MVFYKKSKLNRGTIKSLRGIRSLRKTPSNSPLKVGEKRGVGEEGGGSLRSLRSLRQIVNIL